MPIPVNSNLLQRMRQVLYSLKRQYGFRIDIYKLLGSETDVRTGVKTVTKQKFVVYKAVVLPATISREVQQSISEISANKEFVTGGTFDIGARTFIIDRRDCPTLPSLTADDWIVYDGKKYQIKTAQCFEPNAGWIIKARALEGEVPEPNSLTAAAAPDSLTLTSTASAVVE